jgi:hypothetical protein
MTAGALAKLGYGALHIFRVLARCSKLPVCVLTARAAELQCALSARRAQVKFLLVMRSSCAAALATIVAARALRFPGKLWHNTFCTSTSLPARGAPFRCSQGPVCTRHDRARSSFGSCRERQMHSARQQRAQHAAGYETGTSTMQFPSTFSEAGRAAVILTFAIDNDRSVVQPPPAEIQSRHEQARDAFHCIQLHREHVLCD